MSEQMEGELSRIELKLEQEKLKIEHERIALERERLDAARERMKDASQVNVNREGELSVRMSTVALSSIICLLVGGILGALSMSIQYDRTRASRLQEVMRSLNEMEIEPQVAEVATTNEPVQIVATLPPKPVPTRPTWVRKVRAKGGNDSGVSLIVVQ